MKKIDKQIKKNKKGKAESIDEPMKLRKRNQKQKYYESSQSDSDSPSPVRIRMQGKEKNKQIGVFKMEEYNHKIKNNPNVCQKLQGIRKKVMIAVLDTQTERIIRSINYKGPKVFENLLESEKISDPFQIWAPDNNFTIFHKIANCYHLKFWNVCEIYVRQTQVC